MKVYLRRGGEISDELEISITYGLHKYARLQKEKKNAQMDKGIFWIESRA